ncbi:MAG TPA: SGNH/GDSL hydrolase family protein [Thermoanaerobaculia bacterium]|nr:SGNH/GDSL hydrolase family protein [Thermoanaerobaculia bacterium]
MRPRRLLARFALAAAATLFALAGLEAALRLIGWSYPNFYRPEPVRGWGLRPGAAARWRHEGDAQVRVNRDGLRDEEHPHAKPPGELRIALLGDSMVEAIQVPRDRTFWELAERRLEGCEPLRGRRVEVLDFGVSGYGTAQELLTLRHEVWKYRPDLVLLGFYAGNDVRNNHRPLEQDPLRPYFTLAGDPPRLVLDDSFRQNRGYRLRRSLPGRVLYGLLDNSRALQLGKQAKAALDGRVGAWKARRSTRGEAALQELGLDNAVYGPPPDAEWRQAWRVTEELIRAMHREARARGARFAVVTLTTPIQVHPDPAERRRYARRLGVPDLLAPERRLAALARREGFPLLALAPDLQRHATRTRTYLHGFPNTAPGQGHWNWEGHRVAGNRLADWLCREVLAPPSPPPAR